MNRGCKHHIGDIVRGLEIISDPYKNDGKRDYIADVKCQFCKREYTIVLSEIHRHVFDGCGCQKSMINSKKWYSFKSWCEDNDSEDLLSLWDMDLNKISPDKISSCTSKEYYFKCPNGLHKSELHKPLVLTRAKHAKTICRQCNSIAQKLIDKFGNDAIDIYWDSEKNSEDPWFINFGTKKEYWIKCPTGRHPSYYGRFQHLITRNIGCKMCSDERTMSEYQKNTFCYIQDTYGYNIKIERECSIIATNPQTGYLLPYDNDVFINDEHLIIEVNGEQHYTRNWFSQCVALQNNITIDMALQQQQYRDKIKREYVESLSKYHYLELPYWSFKDDSYKSIIDDAIHKILSTAQN